ncbi:hypothetical protein M569_00514, partial [Genlisea aurea]
MKEKAHGSTPFLKKIIVNCSAQAKEYGGCVSSRIPHVEKDMCLKEFLVLKNCMQNVKYTWGVLKNSVSWVSLVIRLIFLSSNTSAGASSSSSSRLGFSSALSHVYIQYPPLSCHVPGSRKLLYDDGNRLIIAVTSNQVFSWKIAPYDPCVAALSDPISEGPVLSIRYSLDLKLLAIQRSSVEIQIWNRDTRDTFCHKCRPESENILGFFWSDCPTFNLVIIKTSGLDFHTYNSGSQSLQLVETRKLNINWYSYTHESRLVLLSSGMQCKSFTGYQLSSIGTIRLPKFDMVMAKSETNNKPILAAEDVHIITVYGRIYCLQLDKVAMLLHIYRFYRDAVLQQ